VASLVGVAAAGAFGAATVDALATGDAAVYARSIADRNLCETTVHVGYYLLGMAATPMLPFPPDRSLNVLSAMCGAATVACVWLLAVGYTRRASAGVAAVAVLCCNDLFVREALFAEVYGPQLAFCTAAVLLWMRGRAIVAGLTLSAAALISPTALLLLPAMIVMRPGAWLTTAAGTGRATGATPCSNTNSRDGGARGAMRLRRPLQRGPRFADAIRLAVAGLTPWLAVAAWHYEDYALGPRGILKAFGASLSFYEAASKEWSELLYGFLSCLPWVAFGVWFTAATRRYRCWIGGIALAWILGLTLGERYPDVPLQLPLYALLCVTAGIGFDATFRASAASVRLRRLAAACPAAGVVLVAWMRGPQGDEYLAGAAPMTLIAVASLAAIVCLTMVWSPRRPMFTAAPAVLGLAVCVGLSTQVVLTRVRDRRADHVAFKRACLELRDAAGPEYVVLSEWSRGILFEHYVFGDAYTRYWINMEWLRGEWGESVTQRAQDRWREAIEQRQEVWLFSGFDEAISELAAAEYEMTPFRMFLRATATPWAQPPPAGSGAERSQEKEQGGRRP